MKFSVIFLLLIIFSLKAQPQVIPADRHPDWRLAIANFVFNEPKTIVNVKDFGAVGDGVNDDYEAISSAISSLKGRLGSVYFPKGNYLIHSLLMLPDSVILQGLSSDSTMLSFDLEQQVSDCISISKGQGNSFVRLVSAGPNGSKWFTIADVSGFVAGDYIELRETNGSWDVVPADWAMNSVGQITQITDIQGDTIFFKSPLRIDFDLSLQPEVRKIDPIVNSGVRCLKIKRMDSPADGAGSNIMFSFAAQCMVKGIESDSSVGSHISINTSANILISGCYIHHAFIYDGSGTRGYGVTMSQHSSECLVLNNVFKHLRHAMMVKTGSNGNIFAYNYSIEPYRSESIHDFSGDISLHGHFAFANLFEGNIVQNIIIDHYWGPSGPFNTLFRNSAELYGIYMTSSNLLETNRQNFVGNEVVKPNFPYGQYVLTGSDHFEFGNNISGTILPAGTDNLPDSSYFLDSRPDFWNENLNWPSVGIPNILNSGSIPARDRYVAGSRITVCEPDSTTTAINSLDFPGSGLKIWPNPTNNHLNIRVENIHGEHFRFSVISMVGNKIWETDFIADSNASTVAVDLRGIVSPGLYLLKAESTGHSYVKRLFVID